MKLVVTVELAHGGSLSRASPSSARPLTVAGNVLCDAMRRIRLLQGVDADAVTTSMDNGVLSLIVPKPEMRKLDRLAQTR